jgi:hypothetical protein
MDEKYIIGVMILLLFLYIYKNNLNGCIDDNKKTYKYFDQMYYGLPLDGRNDINLQRQSLIQNPQESINSVDETLTHFKGNGKEKFNAQLSRESDSSIVDKHSNGSPMYANFVNGTIDKLKRTTNDIDMKWNSYMEDYTEDASTERADGIDSKYNEVVKYKGDSHFYKLNNKR